jgi:predicted TIM-barrel fold metal-dependent hydrolase
MIAAMDLAGVEGALLVSPMLIYGYDASVALAAYAAHPRRFRVVKPIDPADPGLNRALAASGRLGLPVNIQCWGRLDQFAGLAARHPDTAMLIDHLGLPQPAGQPMSGEPFADLPKVLELAAYPQVAIKLTGACTLSRERFPFADLWEPLGRIFDAFGIERCLWGTDWTRALASLTYRQGVEAFLAGDRLSDSDRAMLMGGTLSRIYGWDA